MKSTLPIEYVKHYLFALLATMVNGGVAAVAGVVGTHQALTFHNIWSVFEPAACFCAFMYLSAHPIPIPALPGQPPTALNPYATKVAVAPAPISQP